MHLYRIADLRLASAVLLPGVPPASHGTGAWCFRISRRALDGRPEWYHHADGVRGTRWRSLARSGDAHIIRFHRRARFSVAPPEREIICSPCEGVPLETVRQLLLGQVMPLVLADRRRLVLHASAVRVGGGVLAFVGRTGMGKSTLAAAIASRGYSLVADDCLLVDVAGPGYVARPVNLGIRLHAGRDEKRRFTAEELGIGIATRSAPLRGIYLLDPDARASVLIEEFGRRAAVVELLSSAFQLGLDEPAHTRSMFELLTDVAARVAVRRLSVPRGLEHLDAVVDRLLEDA